MHMSKNDNYDLNTSFFPALIKKIDSIKNKSYIKIWER